MVVAIYALPPHKFALPWLRIDEDFGDTTNSSVAPFFRMSFVFPQDGATVSSSVVVLISASSSQEIVEINLYREDDLLGQMFSYPSDHNYYVFIWDTTKEFNGSHLLKAVASVAGTTDLNLETLITTAVVGGLSPPPPPLSLIIKQCQAESSTLDICSAFVKNEADKANYCGTVSDCSMMMGSGAIYPCGGPLVNKNEADRIRQLITDFYKVYPEAANSRSIVECAEVGVACVDERCRYQP